MGGDTDECRRTLPGDELAPPTTFRDTRAITIDAPPEEVWSWLVQIGWDRGGFYSYDWLENVFGGDLHNIDRIDPDLQQLAAGDVVWMAPPERFDVVAMLTVSRSERGRCLVFTSPARRDPARPDGTWAFVLEPLGSSRTRLIVRWQQAAGGLGRALFFYVLFEPAHFIMERGMLLGIKRRAERVFWSSPPRVGVVPGDES